MYDSSKVSMLSADILRKEVNLISRPIVKIAEIILAVATEYDLPFQIPVNNEIKTVRIARKFNTPIGWLSVL